MALEMADDMALSEFFGLIGQNMLSMAGNAVKAYPHPLLLNNYGAMVMDKVGPEEALKFFELAAIQDSENPVILTNAANIFIELDDFTSAEAYAKRALSASNDFGPAYQDEQMAKTEAARESAENRLLEMTENFQASSGNTENPEILVYPVLKSQRQIYAIRVITSFYEYKIKQLECKYNKAYQDDLDRQFDDLDKNELTYAAKYEQVKKGVTDAEIKTWNSVFSGGKADADKIIEAVLLEPQLQVIEQEECIAIIKMHTNEIIRLSQNYYNEMKQVLEEYWLKTDALFKYVQQDSM